MLKTLQKALGVKDAKPALTVELNAAAIAEAVQAALAGVQAEFDEFKQTAEALVAAAEEQVASLTAQLAEANEKLAEAAVAFADSEADKVAAEAAALAAKLAARKEKVVAALGTERADALLTVTDGMDDAAFEAIVAALGVSAATEAANPLFNEVGVEAAADPAKITHPESKEMKILREKYQNQDK